MSQTSLSKQIPAEIGCAMISAATVAPFISIIDKAIFSNASGRESLGKSLVSGIRSMVFQPLHFVRQPSFLLIYGVYSSTYVVANVIQAVCDDLNHPWQIPKFIGTSFANVGLSVLKDLYFTRAFGTGPVKSVTLPSYSLYTMRDTITIFASFNLPPIVSEELQSIFKVKSSTADTVAQLITPCVAQLASTPLHLLGMDIYNRPKVTGKERMVFLGKEYVKTTAARIGRIFPAYGVGGVVNKKLRSYSKSLLA